MTQARGENVHGFASGAGVRRRGRARFLIFAGAALALAGLALAVLGACGTAEAQAQVQAQESTGPRALTLKQAVTLATQANSDLALARLRYQVTERQTRVTRSRFLPNLYAGSGVAYTSGFPLVAGGGAPALFSLSYDEALFDRQGRGELRVAEQQMEQQRIQVDTVRDAVIVRVASSYLELAKVRRESDLMRKERDSAQEILDYTRKRVEAGYELPIELTKAQLTAARIGQRLAQLEDEDESLADTLRTLLGMAADQRVEVMAEDIPAAANQTAGDLVQQALEHNNEIKQAESERAASEARLRGERGSRWPTISIIGQYNVLAKFNNYDLFFNKFQRNNVIAGLDVRIPIFASRTSATVAAAEASVTAARAAVASKRSELSVDVRHKARQAHEMDMGREVARLELELAQDNLQVLQAQFQQGRISIRDMQSAQLEENDKWLAFLDADFARQQAQLDLLHATGQVATLLQ